MICLHSTEHSARSVTTIDPAHDIGWWCVLCRCGCGTVAAAQAAPSLWARAVRAAGLATHVGPMSTSPTLEWQQDVETLSADFFSRQW